MTSLRFERILGTGVVWGCAAYCVTIVSLNRFSITWQMVQTSLVASVALGILLTANTVDVWTKYETSSRRFLKKNWLVMLRFFIIPFFFSMLSAQISQHRHKYALIFPTDHFNLNLSLGISLATGSVAAAAQCCSQIARRTGQIAQIPKTFSWPSLDD